MKYQTIAILLLFVHNVFGQYEETTSQFGISVLNTNSNHGNGVCFVDFDGDGWDDLTLATRNQQIKFYRNISGFFVSQNYVFTPGLPLNGDIKCPLWFDYDNDGDKDLFVSAINLPLMVYQNNGSMSFTNIAGEIGLNSENVIHSGLSAGDYNNDGCLDLFVGKYYNPQFFTEYEHANQVYMNNCDGTFTDVTISSGIGQHIQATLCAVWIDYNMDGFQDLYVGNDKFIYGNYMYKNNGDGTFTDVSESTGAGVNIDTMTLSCDDYDHDGDLDIFITNSPFSPFMIPESNFLLKYDSATETYSEVGDEAGLNSSEVCWGSLWMDYDNNTWNDLFVATVGSGLNFEAQNLFFINEGNGTFDDGIATVGIEEDEDATYAAAMGDYDKDGFYDYATNNIAPTPASVWHNVGGQNTWLAVSVEGTISNKDGIGTWIECYAGGNKYVLYTFCGEAFMGQNSEDEIFGLGNYNVVDSLKLKWLSGLVETYYNLPVKTRHHFIEGQSIAGTPAQLYYEDLILCPGETTTISAENSLQYLWSTGDTTQTITVTEPGEYFVTITGLLGIPQSSETLVVSSAPIPIPVEVFTNVTCYGASDGTTTIDIESGEIGSVNWEVLPDGPVQTNLAPGTYHYTLIDVNGCQDTGSVVITQPDSLFVILSSTNTSCFGAADGTAQLVVSGGTPSYTINWFDVNPNSLIAGNYMVEINDSLGCTISTEYSISEPDLLTISVQTTPEYEDADPGSAELSIFGGTEPYSILWSNGIEDEYQLTNLESGFYSVTVIDSMQCDTTIVFNIDFIINIDNIFGDQNIRIFPNPFENYFQIENVKNEIVSVQLRNLEGQLILNRAGTSDELITISIPELANGLYILTLQTEKKVYQCYLSHFTH